MIFEISDGHSLATLDFNFDTPIDIPVLRIGCDMNYVNKNFDRVTQFLKQFSNVQEYYERCIEALITHELIHLSLSEVDLLASYHFDKIDENHEVSGSELDPKGEKDESL